MTKQYIISVLFIIIFSTFNLSACDDGGGENNNNQTVDQDVKDWCAEWLYCSEDDRSFDNIPWETQEECEEIVQYIKKHQLDEPYLEACHNMLLRASVVTCSTINVEWGMEEGSCKYTPYGYCPDGTDESCP